VTIHLRRTDGATDWTKLDATPGSEPVVPVFDPSL